MKRKRFHIDGHRMCEGMLHSWRPITVKFRKKILLQVTFAVLSKEPVTILSLYLNIKKNFLFFFICCYPNGLLNAIV